MQKKIKGILLFSKVHKENDLYIKFLSNDDELVSGIVYGGLSKKKNNLYQLGFFLDFNIFIKTNKVTSINAELTAPYMSQIINDKFKLHCLLSTISIINLSILEGQKVNNIFKYSENFFKILTNNKQWLISHLNYLLDLLKLIGYDIDHLNNFNKTFFDLEKLNFLNDMNNSSIEFPHKLLSSNNVYKKNHDEILNFFKIFETVFEKNHLLNINLYLPNHYHLFKKLLLEKLKI